MGMESTNPTFLLESDSMVQVKRLCIILQGDKKAQAMLVNMTGFTQTLPACAQIGTVSECVEASASVTSQRHGTGVRVNKVMPQDMVNNRKEKLRTLINKQNCTLSIQRGKHCITC